VGVRINEARQDVTSAGIKCEGILYLWQAVPQGCDALAQNKHIGLQDGFGRDHTSVPDQNPGLGAEFVLQFVL